MIFGTTNKISAPPMDPQQLLIQAARTVVELELKEPTPRCRRPDDYHAKMLELAQEREAAFAGLRIALRGAAR